VSTGYNPKEFLDSLNICRIRLPSSHHIGDGYTAYLINDCVVLNDSQLTGAGVVEAQKWPILIHYDGGHKVGLDAGLPSHMALSTSKRTCEILTG
jgi:hypothetical protein